VKLVQLVDFIIKKFVTMRGHVNVKLAIFSSDVYSNTIFLLNM